MSTSDEPREFISLETALSLLPDGDAVHTFRMAGSIWLGADMNKADLVEKLRAANVIEVAGPMARSLRHGLCITDHLGHLFIETKDQA